MNCHTAIRPDSRKLEPIKQSYESGLPVEWVWVNRIADYAYFNHAAHVNRGVGCVECHGRIDQMEVVMRHEMLSMGWCLIVTETRSKTFVQSPRSPISPTTNGLS